MKRYKSIFRENDSYYPELKKLISNLEFGLSPGTNISIQISSDDNVVKQLIDILKKAKYNIFALNSDKLSPMISARISLVDDEWLKDSERMKEKYRAVLTTDFKKISNTAAYKSSYEKSLK